MSPRIPALRGQPCDGVSDGVDRMGATDFRNRSERNSGAAFVELQWHAQRQQRKNGHGNYWSDIPALSRRRGRSASMDGDAERQAR